MCLSSLAGLGVNMSFTWEMFMFCIWTCTLHLHTLVQVMPYARTIMSILAQACMLSISSFVLKKQLEEMAHAMCTPVAVALLLAASLSQATRRQVPSSSSQAMVS